MEAQESCHENENSATTPPLVEEPVPPHPETRINRFFACRYSILRQRFTRLGLLLLTYVNGIRSVFDLSSVSERTLGLVGMALGVGAVGAQVLFPDVWPLWVFCVSVGFTSVIWILLRASLGQYLRLRYIAGIVCLAFAFLVWISVRQAYKLHELPDVEMRIVYPKSASVQLVNPSSKVVNRPKYQIGLWNIDRLESLDPLPIPVRTGDYIRPYEGLGPNQLVSLPRVAPLLDHGNRLFGFGMVLCPDCKSTHFYWIYIEHGIGGWFSELPQGQVVDINALLAKIPTIAKNLDQFLDELVPKTTRVSIKNWPIP